MKPPCLQSHRKLSQIALLSTMDCVQGPKGELKQKYDEKLIQIQETVRSIPGTVLLVASTCPPL